MQKKKIVVIGGGNGSAVTIRALKTHKDIFDISAVVSMSDSGGSSGRLRREFNTLPPGDIMRAILAMSRYDFDWLKKIFYSTRFSNTGKLSDHNLGNLFLTFGNNYDGDYANGLKALEQALDVVGKVYPSTTDSTDLVAELTNGEVVKGEADIDRPSYGRSLKIKKAWLEPTGEAYKKSREVIEEADFITLGPGSLYTSIVAAILPNGLKETINRSKAKLIFIAGGKYEKMGETGPERLSDFVLALQKYLPRKIDYVVHNSKELNEKGKKRYQEKEWEVFEFDPENIREYNVVSRDYENPDGFLSYESLGRILKDIIVGEKV